MKKIILLSLAISIAFLYSCTKDHDGKTQVDEDIENLLSDRGLKLEDFQLPRPGELDKIPQVEDNPLTQAKIDLGRSIFWDPVFNQNTFGQSSRMTASCGSCHIKDGHAGVRQGLGEGGQGAGLTGEQRVESPTFIGEFGNSKEFIDAQPIRPPTNMHVAYKPNALWNGALGNPKKGILNLDRPNHNANVTFDNPEFPFDEAEAFDGFAGPEAQGMAGLRVHRYKFNEEVITNAGSGYKELFEQVFVNDPRTRIIDKFNNEFVQDNMFWERGRILLTNSAINDDTSDDEMVPVQFSRLAAAMAISAYTRSVLANEAPFQNYVYGDPNGMTEQEKRGFKTFLEANCVNCHNGPALTDADFHVMGTRDLLDLDVSLADRVSNPIAGFVEGEGDDLGREAITGNDEDRGAFMTQTLYNLPITNFFHGGEAVKPNGEPFELDDAVQYMLDAEPFKQGFVIDDLWEKQTISDGEKADLVAFLRTGLRDNRFEEKYRPGFGLPNILSCDNTAGPNETYLPMCSPNNDATSTISLGNICCD